MTSEVVLHQWEISPFCGKVRKILRPKGIAHQSAVSAQLDEMLRTSTLADRIRRRPNVARWLATQSA